MRRCFTIIELLVAITLTVVVTNIMSQMYVRMSDVAVRQVGTMGAIDGAAKTVNMIVDDLKKAALVPGRDLNNHDRDFRMIHGYANDFSSGNKLNGFDTNIKPDITNKGWPVIGFTQDRGDSLDVLGDMDSGTSDGYQEVFYLLAPPENSATFKQGGVGDDLLVLYRIEDDAFYPNVSNDFSDPKEFNSSHVLFDNVIYMSMIHHQTNCSNGVFGTNSQIWLDTDDPVNHNYHFDADITEGEDPFPDAVDVVLTLAPEGAYHEFKVSREVSGIASMSANLLSGSSTYSVSEKDDIEKTKPFKFDNQGFFYREADGQVFFYKTIMQGKEQKIEIFYVAASGEGTSIGDTDQLVTGKSSTVRVVLK